LCGVRSATSSAWPGSLYSRRRCVSENTIFGGNIFAHHCSSSTRNRSMYVFIVLFWWLFVPCPRRYPSTNSNFRFSLFLSRLSRPNSRLDLSREFVRKHLISYMILRRNDRLAAKADEIPGLFPVQREFAIINGGGAAASAGRARRFSPPRADRAVDRERCWLGF